MSSLIADNDNAAPILIDCSLFLPFPMVKDVALTKKNTRKFENYLYLQRILQQWVVGLRNDNIG